jgi:hypothetical protein
MNLFLKRGFCGWFNSTSGFIELVEAPIPDQDPISFDQVDTKFRSSKD